MADKKFAIVLGTRPEILKFTPIIKEFEKRHVKHKVYFTGQHFSKSMGENFFKELDIKVSEEFPGKFNKHKVLPWLEQKLQEYEPDVVLVQGDTLSAFLGAMAGVETKTPIAHVEAGLRSFNFDEPYPEEYYRSMIDAASTFLFFPTEMSGNNVLRDQSKKYYIVGNTIIDMIQKKKQDIKHSNQVLITIHRRENWDRIKGICRAINCLANNLEQYKFVWVKHANKKLANNISRALTSSNVELINPQPYSDFIKLMSESKLIITDSGGLVEEASALGIPLVIVREETERYEAIHNGNAVLAGTDAETIISNAYRILNVDDEWERMANAGCPFGEGDAAKKIVSVLLDE